jgi:hypothetical protein
MTLFSSTILRGWFNRVESNYEINAVAGFALDLIDLGLPDVPSVGLLREQASPRMCLAAVRLLELDRLGPKGMQIEAACRLLEMASAPERLRADTVPAVDESKKNMASSGTRVPARGVRVGRFADS